MLLHAVAIGGEVSLQDLGKAGVVPLLEEVLGEGLILKSLLLEEALVLLEVCWSKSADGLSQLVILLGLTSDVAGVASRSGFGKGIHNFICT